MGQKVAKVRSLEDSNAEFKERLLFLEIVTKRHLDAELGTFFSEGDEDGFILEVHYIQMGHVDQCARVRALLRACACVRVCACACVRVNRMLASHLSSC